MKIGDIEVPDAALEEHLKKSGKRVVDETDYVKKAEAAGDLARFRSVAGETRTVEELAVIFKKHEEDQLKNKTESELMKLKLDKVSEELKEVKKAEKEARFEVRKTQINRVFEQAMEIEGLRVIEPILDEFRKEFYTLDESKFTDDELKGKIKEALTKAAEKQNAELARLGLGNAPVADSGQGFGGVYIAPTRGVQLPTDPWEVMKRTSAGPNNAPFGNVAGPTKK